MRAENPFEIVERPSFPAHRPSQGINENEGINLGRTERDLSFVVVHGRQVGVEKTGNNNIRSHSQKVERPGTLFGKYKVAECLIGLQFLWPRHENRDDRTKTSGASVDCGITAACEPALSSL